MLGAVLNALAGEHGLTSRVADGLAGTKLPHLDQANESDMNLLTRLGQRFDAVATMEAGTLIFTPIDAGTTTTSKPLPTATLTRRMAISTAAQSPTEMLTPRCTRTGQREARPGQAAIGIDRHGQ